MVGWFCLNSGLANGEGLTLVVFKIKQPVEFGACIGCCRGCNRKIQESLIRLEEEKEKPGISTMIMVGVVLVYSCANAGKCKVIGKWLSHEFMSRKLYIR